MLCYPETRRMSITESKMPRFDVILVSSTATLLAKARKWACNVVPPHAALSVCARSAQRVGRWAAYGLFAGGARRGGTGAASHFRLAPRSLPAAPLGDLPARPTARGAPTPERDAAPRTGPLRGIPSPPLPSASPRRQPWR